MKNRKWIGTLIYLTVLIVGFAWILGLFGGRDDGLAGGGAHGKNLPGGEFGRVQLVLDEVAEPVCVGAQQRADRSERVR